MTGIFIKTYPGDFEWLRFLLRSIDKFAEGFEEVTIVTDHGVELGLPPKIKDMPVYVTYTSLPAISHPCPVGVGYVWAQNIKLNWFRYTACDSVLSIDSDCMFTAPVTPATWQDGKGNWKWSRRKYADIVADGFKDVLVHKPPADAFMKRDVIWHNMLFNGWILLRDHTKSMQHYVKRTFNCDVWEYLNNISRPLWANGGWGSCEYEMYGNFIDQYRPEGYVFGETPKEFPFPPVRQSWSWGGIKEEEIKAREEFLK